MLLNTSFPPGEPPIYPIALEPEQPLHATLFAPPDRVFALSSASGVVSLGPADHLPVAVLRTQFISLFWRCQISE